MPSSPLPHGFADSCPLSGIHPSHILRALSVPYPLGRAKILSQFPLSSPLLFHRCRSWRRPVIFSQLPASRTHAFFTVHFTPEAFHPAPLEGCCRYALHLRHPLSWMGLTFISCLRVSIVNGNEPHPGCR